MLIQKPQKIQQPARDYSALGAVVVIALIFIICGAVLVRSAPDDLGAEIYNLTATR